jgi:hypothetical protein
MERFLLTLLCVAFFVLCLYGMWRGWRRQAREQSVLVPPFPQPPEQPGEPVLEAHGLYVATTNAGRWQQRIVTRGAGLRTTAVLRLHSSGIEVERVGAPGFWIPRESVTEVRTAKGMAGKVMGSDSLLVITWRLRGPTGAAEAEVMLDTGFRADDRGVHEEWIETLRTDRNRSSDAGEIKGGAQV